MPRGDDRDLRGSNRHGDAAAPFFLRLRFSALITVCCKLPQRRFLSGRWSGCLSNFHLVSPRNAAKSCTGSLIGGKHVLTAGHCLFKSSLGGWATSIRAMPGLDGKIPGHLMWILLNHSVRLLWSRNARLYRVPLIRTGAPIGAIRWT